MLAARRPTPKYLGTNNIAGMKWCHQKFIFRAEANEGIFRRAYEDDCKRLGENLSVDQLITRLEAVDRRVVTLPDGREAVVSKWGGKITPADVATAVKGLLDAAEVKTVATKATLKQLGQLAETRDRVLKRREEAKAGQRLVEGEEELIGGILQVLSKEEVRLMGAAKDSRPTAYAESDAGTHERIVIETTDGLGRGLFAQYKYGEQLPSIRYHFAHRDHIIEADPDGISSDYCYEFKLVGERFWHRFVRPTAVLQASLYSYFFQRPKYRIDVYIENERTMESLEGEVDSQWVQNELDKIDGLLSGSLEPLPPNRVKCSSCEFSHECPTRQPS